MDKYILDRNFYATDNEESKGSAGPEALVSDLDNIFYYIKHIEDLIDITKVPCELDENGDISISLKDSIDIIKNRLMEILNTNDISNATTNDFNKIFNHLQDINNPHKITADDINTFTKDELLKYFGVQNTIINYEIFTISEITADSFKYVDSKNNTYTSTIENGYYIFNLKGNDENGLGYKYNANSIEAIINDTLIRSYASGGLMEYQEDNSSFSKKVGLNNLFSGSEITFKYFSKMNFCAKHGFTHINSSDELIHIGSTQNSLSSDVDSPIWFCV